MRGIDLFAGPGGLTLGFKRAGIETVCAVERNPDAVDTFRGHTPRADVRCENICRVDLSPYRSKVDLIYGGPPCQPFSTGGLRRAAADRRNMIPAFLKAVETVRPAALLMENVPGLAVKSRISYLHQLLDDLRNLGYHPSWRVLNAAHYGVPQKRRRLFVVAYRDHLFWFPRPTHGRTASRPIVPSKTAVTHTPKGQPPNCPVVFAKYPDLRPSPYAGHVYNGGGRPINLDEPCHTILASAGGYKTHWVDTENIAPKYHAHLMGGGEPWQGEVPGARRMTIVESALVQTFPRSMTFAGSQSSQYTQVGDAVPPLLAEHLGNELVRQMYHSNRDAKTHYPPENQLPLFSPERRCGA